MDFLEFTLKYNRLNQNFFVNIFSCAKKAALPARSFRGLLGAFVVASLLAGCTTTSSVTSRTMTSANTKISQDKDRREAALENYIQLGIGYLRNDEREQARANFRRALDIDSRAPTAHNGMALLYQLSREFELAEKHFQQAIAYDSGFTQGRNNYAVFLVHRGRLEEAYQQLLVAVNDLDYPNRGQLFLSLGEVASGLGKKAEAVTAWQRAIGINPRAALPYLSLAEVSFDEGDYPKAKAYLDQYSRLSKPTASSLWLAVRIEDAFNNPDGVASKGLALTKLFPYSEQTLAYQQWLQEKSR